MSHRKLRSKVSQLVLGAATLIVFGCGAEESDGANTTGNLTTEPGASGSQSGAAESSTVPAGGGTSTTTATTSGAASGSPTSTASAPGTPDSSGSATSPQGTPPGSGTAAAPSGEPSGSNASPSEGGSGGTATEGTATSTSGLPSAGAGGTGNAGGSDGGEEGAGGGQGSTEPDPGLPGAGGTGTEGPDDAGTNDEGAGDDEQGAGGAAGDDESGDPEELPSTESGAPRSMGYVGCSMSVNVTTGYQALGGERLWPPIQTYNGKVVQNWANSSDSAWQAFEQQMDMNGTPDTVWVMLCIFNNMVTYDETKQIIANVRERAPDAVIYITGQPVYEEGLTCDLAGAGGPELTDQRAREAAADETQNVIYGGLFGPLNSAQRQDSCHANTEGQRALGQQAIDKWGE